jgi:hypothetical protein
MPKEIPINFNGITREMVRAILDGRKTRASRPILHQPTKYGLSRIETHDGFAVWRDDGLLLGERSEDGGSCQRLCPFGDSGDRLWVQETWRQGFEPSEYSKGIIYRADAARAMGMREYSDFLKWRRSSHMPRSASRITLEITDVRVERVQSISEEDAIAEGFAVRSWESRDYDPAWARDIDAYAVNVFSGAWDCIYAKRGFSWEKNPWVWVISFKVVT